MSGQLTSTLATGTAPFAVTSTTVNTNLNADLLDGYHYNNLPYLANASGTTNYLAKFTGANSIGNSVIYDNGTNVGIGTTSPGTTLDVVGTGRFSSTLTASNGFTLLPVRFPSRLIPLPTPWFRHSDRFHLQGSVQPPTRGFGNSGSGRTL